MKLVGKSIGFAVTGSHCTLEKALPQMEMLVQQGAELQIIVSENILTTDTKFGKAGEWQQKFRQISDKPIITSIVVIISAISLSVFLAEIQNIIWPSAPNFFTKGMCLSYI